LVQRFLRTVNVAHFESNLPKSQGSSH
jgi:hypothetical protein